MLEFAQGGVMYNQLRNLTNLGLQRELEVNVFFLYSICLSFHLYLEVNFVKKEKMKSKGASRKTLVKDDDTRSPCKNFLTYSFNFNDHDIPIPLHTKRWLLMV